MNEKNTALAEKLRMPTPKDRVKFRVGFKSRDESQACMLAYVDARYVMDTLDDIIGADNWDLDYREIHGNLFCIITVTWPDGSKTSKMDCGTETDVEKEKGQASDAFKRAAVHFGIGRDLYGLPDYWAPINEYGYAEKNWTPPGWGADAGTTPPTTEPHQAPSHPTTTNPQPEPATDLHSAADIADLQEYADSVVERASQTAPDTPKTPEMAPKSADNAPQVNNQGLKEGTPPEDELLNIENLILVAQTEKSWLLLPVKHEDKKVDKDFSGHFWVPKSKVPGGLELTSSGKSPVDNQPREIYKARIPEWLCEQALPDGSFRFKEDELPF